MSFIQRTNVGDLIRFSCQTARKNSSRWPARSVGLFSNVAFPDVIHSESFRRKFVNQLHVFTNAEKAFLDIFQVRETTCWCLFSALGVVVAKFDNVEFRRYCTENKSNESIVVMFQNGSLLMFSGLFEKSTFDVQVIK